MAIYESPNVSESGSFFQSQLKSVQTLTFIMQGIVGGVDFCALSVLLVKTSRAML